MNGDWGILLGASSGMGLATAKKMASAGMNLVLIHRDRRSVMEEINQQFDELATQVNVKSYNTDALDKGKRSEVIDELLEQIGTGKISLLLHSVAKGNLKLMGKRNEKIPDAIGQMEANFAKTKQHAQDVNYGAQELGELDFSLTTQAMATSLLSWTQDLLQAKLFTEKPRVIGLTSEGHHRVWPGYGAVAVAKSSLETLAKYMGVELAGQGVRTNVIQAGITPTPSMEMIPGSELMKSSAKFRNPFGRLTSTEDVANVVYLLCQPEADWINGTSIIVDGGEHLT